MKGTVVMAKMARMESTANELWRKSRGALPAGGAHPGVVDRPPGLQGRRCIYQQQVEAGKVNVAVRRAAARRGAIGAPAH
jgi:hypothetical protein